MTVTIRDFLCSSLASYKSDYVVVTTRFLCQKYVGDGDGSSTGTLTRKDTDTPIGDLRSTTGEHEVDVLPFSTRPSFCLLTVKVVLHLWRTLL